MLKARVVLIVEDSEEDFQTVKRLLGKLTDRAIERCRDARETMQFLAYLFENPASEHRVFPDMILLDLNMPMEDGRSLLTRLKRDERLKRIPVVILTTSMNPKDLKFCYENGAAGYIVKPVDLARFRASLESMVNYWLKAVTLLPPEVTV